MKYTIFHKIRQKENIALKLPSLLISKKEIKRVNSIKFLGIFLDENLMWKDHIRVIEIKILKNLGLPYKRNKKNKCRCVLF